MFVALKRAQRFADVLALFGAAYAGSVFLGVEPGVFYNGLTSGLLGIVPGAKGYVMDGAGTHTAGEEPSHLANVDDASLATMRYLEPQQGVLTILKFVTKNVAEKVAGRSRLRQ